MVAIPFYVSENTFSPVEKSKLSYDETLFFSGVRAFYIKNYQLAAAFFNEIIKKYPSSPFFISAYFLLGDCYKNMNQFTMAIKIYRKAIELAPKNSAVVQTMFSIADIYEKKHMFIAARNIYKKVIKDYVGTKWVKEAQFLVGLSYYKENRCKNAVDYFLNIEKTSEFYPISMILAAECFYRIKDYAKTVLAYYYMSNRLNTIEQKKYYKELGDIALALCKFEDYKEASKVFDYLESSHIDKIVELSYLDRMKCDLKKGDYEDLEFRGKYILQNSKNPKLKKEATKLLDEAKLKKGNLNEKTIDEIMARYKNDPEVVSLALYVYAEKNFRQNDCNKVIYYLKKLKKLYPKSEYNKKASPMAANCINKMLDGFFSHPSREKIEYLHNAYLILKPKKTDLCKLSWGLIFSGYVGYVEKIMHIIKDDECRNLVEAKFFVEMGNNANALELVNGVQKVKPYIYYVNMIFGDINYFNGEYDKAISLYKSALAIKKPLMDDYLRLRLARCLYELKKYNEAIKTLGNINIPLFKDEATYLNGLCLYKMGRYKDAMDVLKNLINNLKYKEKILFYLAMSAYKLGDKKEAIDFYQKLKLVYPHSDYLRVLKALLL